MADPRYLAKTSRQGEFKFAMYIFVETPFSPVFKITRSKIGRTKIGKADLDSPQREVSETGLGFVVALLVA